MIDANTELSRLRQTLKSKNLPDSVINEICNDAARDINNAATDLLADAMIEAVNAGANVSSSDFVSEVMSFRSGSFFEIGTSSGRSDFSEPPFPMLPKLLQSAKTSLSGDLYKVIPIAKRSKTSSSVTTEEAIKNINNARNLAKEQRDAETERTGTAIPDPFYGLTSLSEIQSSNRPAPDKQYSIVKEGPISFRTASSKQNAATQWVKPGRSADLTSSLSDINSNLQDNIDKTILNIVNRYSGMY